MRLTTANPSTMFGTVVNAAGVGRRMR